MFRSLCILLFLTVCVSLSLAAPTTPGAPDGSNTGGFSHAEPPSATGATKPPEAFEPTVSGAPLGATLSPPHLSGNISDASASPDGASSDASAAPGGASVTPRPGGEAGKNMVRIDHRT